MKLFRKNLAIAVDGVGIRGVIVTKALSILEVTLGKAMFELARDPHAIQPGQPEHYYSRQWLRPLFDAFMASSSDQQVHLLDTLFTGLDFRRFQVGLQQSIAMDDVSAIPELVEFGEVMGQMILNDQYDRAQLVEPSDMP